MLAMPLLSRPYSAPPEHGEVLNPDGRVLHGLNASADGSPGSAGSGAYAFASRPAPSSACPCEPRPCSRAVDARLATQRRGGGEHPVAPRGTRRRYRCARTLATSTITRLLACTARTVVNPLPAFGSFAAGDPPVRVEALAGAAASVRADDDGEQALILTSKGRLYRHVSETSVKRQRALFSCSHGSLSPLLQSSSSLMLAVAPCGERAAAHDAVHLDRRCQSERPGRQLGSRRPDLPGRPSATRRRSTPTRSGSASLLSMRGSVRHQLFPTDQMCDSIGEVSIQADAGGQARAARRSARWASTSSTPLHDR